MFLKTQAFDSLNDNCHRGLKNIFALKSLVKNLVFLHNIKHNIFRGPFTTLKMLT